MEELSVLLFIVIILMIISLRKNITKRFDLLNGEIARLKDQLLKSTPERTPEPIQHPPVFTKPPDPVVKTYLQEVKETRPEPKVEKSLSEELNTLAENAGMAATPGSQQPDTMQQPISQPHAIPEPQLSNASLRPSTPRKPGFMERNPDLEKFIGENLVSKIGIVILVLAIGYFVKFAIDNDWIGPVGRVGIGILCGAVLIGVAHALRNSYKAFSSVLAGGGLAVFYFTITLGFHQFQLFSQTVAFVIMVVITCFAVVLSQLYNRQEVAIIALIGGFATPFMVSTGAGNFKILFTYLIILNTGLLVIAYSKAWRLLNLLAFLFTVILFASWLFMLQGTTGNATYGSGLLFATIFYLLFFFINIAHNIRENRKFLASDFGILLSNTCLYFAAGLYLLTLMKAGPYRGLFTAAIGVFNLTASFILLRNRKIDNNILYLLIGITLSFISLTAPIQLNGNNITLFWATEAVLLYWLFQKSKIRIIQYGSLLVWTAMLISLMMDWRNVYGRTEASLPVIINKGFITGIFSAIATYVLFLLRRKSIPGAAPAAIHVPDNVFRVVAIILLFATGNFEIGHQFDFYYPDINIALLYLLLYTLAFVYLFIVLTEKLKVVNLKPVIGAGLLAISILLYLVCIPGVFDVQMSILEQHLFSAHFSVHWLSALLMIMIIYKLVSLLRASQNVVQQRSTILSWVICVVVVIFLSAEAHLLMNQLFYKASLSLSEIQRVYIKTGLPILWGLCSFGFMWLGMQHKYRPLRIISLFLFSLTLIKLFFFDIRNIPVAGKIAAFFSLGILLLVISFMYQRLKNIIIEDEKKPVV